MIRLCEPFKFFHVVAQVKAKIDNTQAKMEKNIPLQESPSELSGRLLKGHEQRMLELLVQNLQFTVHTLFDINSIHFSLHQQKGGGLY